MPTIIPDWRAGLALSALLLLPAAAQAHPHIYIEGGTDFIFAPTGQLTQLRVTWIYDALSSLLMLEELGIAADQAEALSAPDRARLAAYQTSWDPGYDGDGYLWDGPRRVALSGPLNADASLTDGQVTITFLRDLAEPYRPAAGLDSPGATVLKTYDPSYYTAYAVTAEPRLEGARNCAARVLPFTPTGPLTALQDTLSTIPVDGDPAGSPGELLADRILLSCD